MKTLTFSHPLTKYTNVTITWSLWNWTFGFWAIKRRHRSNPTLFGIDLGPLELIFQHYSPPVTRTKLRRYPPNPKNSYRNSNPGY